MRLPARTSPRRRTSPPNRTLLFLEQLEDRTVPSATKLVVTGFPTPVQAGTAGGFTVIAEDALNQPVPDYAGTVHFTSSDFQAALPADYTFTADDQGIHTFGATLKSAGSRSITATDTASTGLSGSETGITVNPAATSRFFVALPGDITAGTAFSLSVTADDAYGNSTPGYLGTVTFTSSDPKASLPAPYTFTAADKGTHGFTSGATLFTAGRPAVTVTDAGGLTGTSFITVRPAPAASLQLSMPAAVAQGSPFNAVLTPVDAYGNPGARYTGTVHLTSSDPAAGLPANFTFFGNPSHAFSVTLNTLGSQTVTATDTGNAALTATATTTVNPEVAGLHFAVSTSVTTTTAGSAFDVTVTALGADNNPAAGYTGSAHFTSTDARAVLPADYTFTAADAGVHVFTGGIVLKTAGGQTLTVTDLGVGGGSSATAAVQVNPGPLVSLAMGGFPGSTVAGVSHGLTVFAEDLYGNDVPGYTGTVTFTSNDPQAVLPGPYTFTAADGGQHDFSATLKTVGTLQWIKATDPVARTFGEQVPLTVVAAPASTFVLSLPANSTAGAAFGFSLTAQDPYGNTTTGYTGTVHFTSTDGQAALPGDYPFTSADAGRHSFSATLNTTGAQTLTATDTASASVTGSGSTTVWPYAVTVAGGGGQSAVVGSQFAQPLQAKVADGHGNPVAGVVVTFTAPYPGPGGTFYGNPVARALTDATGVATSPLLTAGTQAGSFTVTAAVSGMSAPATFFLSSGAASPATVAAAGGSNQSTTAGSLFTTPLQALVTDAYGNPVANVPVTFTAPSSGPSGTFAGPLLSVVNYTGLNGIAVASSFTAGGHVGSYSVTAAVSGNVAPAFFALSNTASAPTAVTAWGGYGQSATVGTQYQNPLQAKATDAYGNPVPGILVTFTAPSSGPGGTFFGNPVVKVRTDANGIATALVLTASYQAGTFGVTAAVFGVANPATLAATNTAAAPAVVAVAGGSGQSATVGAPFGTALQARVTDAYGNPVSGVTVTFTAPSSGPTGSFGGSASATASTDATGVATAPAFTAGTQAGAYAVTAAVTGIGSVSFSLTDTPGAPAAVAAVSGGGQSAPVGTQFAQPLQAQVTDAYGNPVPGILVTFTAPTSGPGGTFYGNPVATVMADAAGVATALLLTADYRAGAFAVSAAVSGVTATASFAATNTAGAPAAGAPAGGSGQSAGAGSAFGTSLQARVTDAYGNPVPGVTVTFTAPGTDPTGSFDGSATVSATTDAGGVATAPAFTAGGRLGTYQVSASVSGVAAAAAFVLTNVPGAPAAVVAVSGGGQTTQVLTTFPRPLVVQVTDAFGNPVPDATVRFTAPASGAGGTFFGNPVADVLTDADGNATSPLLTANGTAGEYTVSASVAGVAGTASFAMTNTPPAT